MRLFALTALAFSLGLSACSSAPRQVPADSQRPHASHSEAPIAGNFPAATQPKLQAGQHWQLIAKDAAQSLVQSLSRSHRCGLNINPCRPVHVAEPKHPTEFSRAFTNALITALVQQGINVSEAPDAALLLHLDVQPVRFTPNRPQYRQAGEAKELAPGIWTLQNPVADGAEGAPQWFRPEFAPGATPRTEIVLTLSVMDGIRYAARSTSVYYVTENDLPLYNQEICSLIRPCPEKAAAPARPMVPVRKATLGIIGD